jgi:hypothetical protein
MLKVIVNMGIRTSTKALLLSKLKYMFKKSVSILNITVTTRTQCNMLQLVENLSHHWNGSVIVSNVILIHLYFVINIFFPTQFYEV